MAETPDDVRCPLCARLLARRDRSGYYVVVHGDRDRVIVRVGTVCCLRCGSTLELDEGSAPILLSGETGLH